MQAPKILFIFGTRPEAIKLCPVARFLKASGSFDVRICVTGQHRELLDQVLAIFDVRPDHDLSVMRPGQSLAEATSRILAALEPVLAAERPSLVLVQGDTTTTFCGALAAFYAGIPVGHVEAGLRTGNLRHPFPEEMNRLLTARLTSIHFAATEWAAGNLRAEGVAPENITVTGNTGIDAVFTIRDLIEAGRVQPAFRPPDFPGRKLILVTAHRRESFGEPLSRICSALTRLADREDVQIVYPVHPNPNVTRPVYELLGGRSNIQLIAPLDYVSFVALMQHSYLLLTDSGGVQEEAPSLGKPVLVLRETTERPEGVEAGTVSLVGTDAQKIEAMAARLLDDEAEYARRSRIHNPYGDGRASDRIAAHIHRHNA